MGSRDKERVNKVYEKLCKKLDEARRSGKRSINLEYKKLSKYIQVGSVGGLWDERDLC